MMAHLIRHWSSTWSLAQVYRLEVTRNYSVLMKSKSLFTTSGKTISVSTPARTRFAPSPTGFLHLGSLRTALYNYLLAKSTGGTFILRIEDTDQKRLVPGAEENIIETLKWCGMTVDEGAVENSEGRDKGEYGPYRQSERSQIYSQYIKILQEKGHAYKCFCPKHRLDSLAESARKLVPPTTVSYDRHCTEMSKEEVEKKSATEPYVIRFHSPKQYPPFNDLLHGKINLQPQINQQDIRYEDPVLVKSDGLPTYHFANVVDDHLMKITHVVRGEEWLASTPKHIALYNAFGWEPPVFIHIPLLTSVSEKKLSKRSGDSDVLSMRKKGILPEALVNFVVLFGWSPSRKGISESSKEVFTLSELEKIFSTSELTKGNAKVDDKKLYFFNKAHLHRLLNDQQFLNAQVKYLVGALSEKYGHVEEKKVSKVLQATKNNLVTINDLIKPQYSFFFETPVLDKSFLDIELDAALYVLEAALTHFEGSTQSLKIDIVEFCGEKYKKKVIFQSARWSLTGNVSGLGIDQIVEILGAAESRKRIEKAIAVLKQ